MASAKCEALPIGIRVNSADPENIVLQPKVTACFNTTDVYKWFGINERRPVGKLVRGYFQYKPEAQASEYFPAFPCAQYSLACASGLYYACIIDAAGLASI